MRIRTLPSRAGKYSAAVYRENAQLWLLMLPTIALIAVFSYVPIYGVLIAFEKFLLGKDILGANAAQWQGLNCFITFASSAYFPRIVRNTVVLSLYSLCFGFLAPILFALLLDQLRNLRFKKLLQTVSYTPHFISTAVVVGMVCSFIYADILLYAFSVFIIFITLYPMYYILIISLSAPQVAMTMKVYTLPIGFNLNAYQVLMKNEEFWHAYKNTLVYLVPNTLLPLITSTLVAYPLTYKKLIGRRLLTWFLLIPMYFSGGLIPSFLLVQKLGMYSSPLAVIIPGCYSISNIILIRSFFRTVPDELREAACIDGAGIYKTLLHVYIPSSTAKFAVIAIYAMVGSWNSWYSAFIYLPKRDWQPLQLYLRRMLTLEATVVSEELSEEAARDLEDFKMSMAQLKYAMIILSTLPILCVYPYFQRFFIKGVMLGSLKE